MGAAFVRVGATKGRGGSFGGGGVGLYAGRVLGGVSPGFAHLRMRSRSSSAREAKLSPPICFVESVQTSSPLVKICCPFSGNENRILPDCATGRSARKPMPPSETFSTVAELFGSIRITKLVFATLRGDWRSSAMAQHLSLLEGPREAIFRRAPFLTARRASTPIVPNSRWRGIHLNFRSGLPNCNSHPS
jgi:hypothetical protein